MLQPLKMVLYIKSLISVAWRYRKNIHQNMNGMFQWDCWRLCRLYMRPWLGLSLPVIPYLQNGWFLISGNTVENPGTQCIWKWFENWKHCESGRIFSNRTINSGVRFFRRNLPLGSSNQVSFEIFLILFTKLACENVTKMACTHTALEDRSFSLIICFINRLKEISSL